jgi:hypothetical protein
MISQAELKNISILFCIFALVYFPMLTSLPLSIDAEVTIRSESHLYWITQGRWAAYIVTFLFPPHLMPYFTLALFGIFSACAYRFLLRACDLAFDLSTIAAFPLFVGFPIWSYILEFSSNVVQVGLGLLCCCGALKLSTSPVAVKELPRSAIAAEIVLLAFAIALYQSFVFVFPALVLSWALIVSPPAKMLVRVMVRAVMTLIAAILIYYVVGKLFALAFGVAPGYVGQFLRPSLVLDNGRDVAARSLQFLLQVYSGAGAIYGSSLYATGILTVLFCFFILWRRSLRDALIALFLLSVPLTFVITAGGQDFPPRALLGIPVAIWAMAIVAMRAREKVFVVLGTAATLLVGFQSASAISGYQTVRLLRSEFDRSTAVQIYTRISEVANVSGPYKVEFFGGLKAPESIYPTGLDSSAGGSFFSWDGGNPNRILAYMWLLGYQDLTPVAPDDRLALIPEFAQMPSWPLRGSVRQSGNLVLVKLGNAPGRYCRPEEIGRLAAC